MPLVQFFEEGVSFKLPHPRKTTQWVRQVINSEKGKAIGLNVIFCTDRYLKKINVEYLQHNTLTDIITFDFSEGDGIQGEIYISVERVKENALKFKSDLDDEIHRVIVHGVLHLLGYTDKSARSKMVMRKKEDAYLSLRR
jgi:probable rRNA maturation factor